MQTEKVLGNDVTPAGKPLGLMKPSVQCFLKRFLLYNSDINRKSSPFLYHCGKDGPPQTLQMVQCVFVVFTLQDNIWSLGTD